MRHFVLPLLAGVILAGAPVDAAIYASDLSVLGSPPNFTLHYLLNEPAISGQITIASAATPAAAIVTLPLTGADLTQGPHDVAFDASELPPGAYVFRTRVTAAPHTGYDVIVPLTPVPGAQSLSYGVKVNVVPGSLGYGHVFTADYGAHVVQEFNAAGAFVQAIPVPDTGTPDGNFSPVGLAIDTDEGNYYFSDQNVDKIYEFSASGSVTKPTWTIHHTFTGPPADGGAKGVLGSRGFQVFGNCATGTVYFTGYALPNMVQRTIFGDTTNPPVALFGADGLAGARMDQILVSPDQNEAYVVSGVVSATAPHLNKVIRTVDANTAQETWARDPNFLENDAATATLLGPSRGVAYALGGKALWVTQSASGAGQDRNYIARVSLVPQPNDPATAAHALRVASGLSEAAPGDLALLDADGSKAVDILDAPALLRRPGRSGAVTDRIPALIPPGATAPVLPFTLDVDIAGNIIVGVNADNSGSPVVGQAFYVIAPPDEGSADATTSPRFRIE